MKQILLAIDGNSLMHRAFWALPPTMTDAKGRHTNAMYGFFNMLFRMVEEYQPTHIAVAFDKGKQTFRHAFFDAYKAGRSATPDELREQFPMVREALTTLGLHYYEQDNYEADDILGALSKQAEAQGMQTFIFTGDRDALQLIDANTSVVLTKKGVSETKVMTQEALMEEMSLTPPQIPDLKGLMGDASDNIPGIAGVGEKTALKLLALHPTVEALYEQLDTLPKNKLYEKLVNGKPDAFLSKQLATIDRDMPLTATLDDFAFTGFDIEKMRAMCEEYRFNAFLKRFDLPAAPPQQELRQAERKRITLDALDFLQGAQRIALHCAQDFYIATDETIEYEIALRQTMLDDGEDLADILQALAPYANQATLILHDVKRKMHEWGGLGLSFSQYFDVMIADWVLNPSLAKYELSTLAPRYDCGEGAASLLCIAQTQQEQIRQNKLDSVLYEIELPLARVLFQMEQKGLLIHEQELRALGKTYELQIENLTKNIYSYAGDPFNIASTKQLATVLFETLGLPVVKKTKTGYSTDVEVLERLQGTHPIIDDIMEYRTLTKLKGTYVDGLLAQMRGGAIHTTFLQTATATGRLSSVEPNLQNIPIRSALANDIRKVFYAPEGYTIVSADYSQIELRILAHCAQDQHLMSAFEGGEDIHARTAAEIMDKDIADVTKEERSSAKAVNFGIVYGISDFGLARNLGIPRKRAANYIERYLEEFDGVRTFMHDVVKQAHADGYVRTLCGRIRYLPDLASRNYNIRSAGERAALNTPIQGSAADVIKLAMLRVAQQFEGLQSQLVLQVHDELIVYAKNEELEHVKLALKDCMEHAMQLSVPLEVNVAEGSTWAEAK